MSQKTHADIKAMKATQYLKELPSTRFSLAGTVLVSLAAGAAAGWTSGLGVWWGIKASAWIVMLPALLSAFFSSQASRLASKRLRTKRSAYLAFFSSLIISAFLLLGSVILHQDPWTGTNVILYGFVFVLAFRVFVLRVTHPYNIFQIMGLSSIHFCLGILALYTSPLLGVMAWNMPALTILVKSVVSLLVIFGGMVFFFALINAPMKRNFGVTSTSLIMSFIEHWFDKTDLLEKNLKPLSEKTDTLVSVLHFKTRSGREAVLLTPILHPGPFGFVGGGKLTKHLTERIEKRTGATVIIGHGTATHDLNPVDTESLDKVVRETLQRLKKLEYSAKATGPVRVKEGDYNLLGIKFDGMILGISTFSPKPTEDIDTSVGLALASNIGGNAHKVMYIDAHNCYKTGKYAIFSGSSKVFMMLKGAKKLREKILRKRPGKLRVGWHVDPLEGYTLKDGVGPTGLRAIVIESGGKKTALIVFDANNMKKGLREKILSRLKEEGFDEAEVMTTDSHCVNNVQGGENPLGERIPEEEIIEKSVNAALKAAENLEEAVVGGDVFRVRGVNVFGPQKAPQLTATINSVIAIAKVAGPVILTLSLAVSLLAIILLG